MIDQSLATIHVSPHNKDVYVQSLNATGPNEEVLAETKEELGAWVSDYLHFNGYLVGLQNSQIFKGENGWNIYVTFSYMLHLLILHRYVYETFPCAGREN